MAQRFFARQQPGKRNYALAVAPSSDARDGATPEVRFVAALRLPELPRLPGLGAASADRNT